MTVAAMTGPTPKTWVRLVPGGAHRGGDLRPGLAELGVDPAQVGQVLASVADATTDRGKASSG